MPRSGTTRSDQGSLSGFSKMSIGRSCGCASGRFNVVAGDVRRALLHTFPYAIYLRVSDEMIVVLAVLHLRRNPKIWRGRVRP